MTKDKFEELFLQIARQSINEAQATFSKEIPKDFMVELHGAGVSGEIMPYKKALDYMYIDSTHFWGCIDVGVKYLKASTTVLFVGISGHKPTSFESTWNTPKGNGPFKVIVPTQLR